MPEILNLSGPLHPQIRPDWLGLNKEEPLEPDLPIIDAHHHLWNRPGNVYRFGEYLEDISSGHNIVATIYVQARSGYWEHGPEILKPAGEIDFAMDMAKQASSAAGNKTALCAAIIGGADLMQGENVAPALERMVDLSEGRLRGIRNQTAWHADPNIRSSPFPTSPGMVASEAFRLGAKALNRFGLSLDVWAYQTQLIEVESLARFLPGLRIIINHAGGPLGIGLYRENRKAAFDQWKTDLQNLAKLPNVHVKLSGLGMRANGFEHDALERPPTSVYLADCIRPYVETAIEIFGPNRCMFESNFPVDKGMYSYCTLWNAFKRICENYSNSDKSFLFHDASHQIYLRKN